MITPPVDARDDLVDRGAMSPADTDGWARKANLLVRPLLKLPHAPAAPAAVELVSNDAADSLFGQWMLTWPEARPDRQLIHHVPDGTVFLRLLERVYAPIFDRHPSLKRLLDNRSRLEMSITNDVLQVQLIPGDGVYSMIRHHSLMLFEATLWLENTSRIAWGELYSHVADFAMAERRNIPSLTELADVEAAGFQVMRSSAARSLDPGAVDELLMDPVMDPLITYQRWAAVGIAVLWRDFAAHEAASEMLWHDRQLGRYQDDNYLTESLWKWL